jgi:hypothetical protein
MQASFADPSKYLFIHYFVIMLAPLAVTIRAPIDDGGNLVNLRICIFYGRLVSDFL